MNMIRHHAPRVKFVPPSVEMLQVARDDFRQFRISQMTRSSFSVQLVIEANREGIPDPASLDDGERAKSAGDLALHRLFFEPELTRDFDGQRVVKPMGDGIGRTLDLRMWEITSRSDL
jgi:hypothetical protein